MGRNSRFEFQIFLILEFLGILDLNSKNSASVLEFQIFLNIELLGILDLLLGYYKNAQFEN